MLVQNGTANEEETFTKKQSTQTYEASYKTKRIPLVRMYGIGWNKATALTIPVIGRDFTHTIEMLTMGLAGEKNEERSQGHKSKYGDSTSSSEWRVKRNTFRSGTHQIGYNRVSQSS
ncbi:hypothetical protein F2Q70_00015969 [Brassica cretica]|uniref:Uncharacterized protein n=1 Tax=Brassica cretica TaxID=69181 RepID=A0A8S9I247_BRACR|nr:hypothetical protein F2Q70_00015969 [Brassica cretica]